MERPGWQASASPKFIPRALAAVPHVDAIQQEPECGGVEPQLAVADIGSLRPAERAALQPLRQDPQAAAIEVEDLEQGPALVGEGEDGSVPRIFPQLVGHQIMETVETAAHVARLHGDEDLQAAGERQHGRASWRRSSTASPSWARSEEHTSELQSR